MNPQNGSARLLRAPPAAPPRLATRPASRGGEGLEGVGLRALSVFEAWLRLWLTGRGREGARWGTRGWAGRDKQEGEVGGAEESSLQTLLYSAT